MKITRSICNELAQELNLQFIKHYIGDDVAPEQLTEWIVNYFKYKLEEKYLDVLK